MDINWSDIPHGYNWVTIDMRGTAEAHWDEPKPSGPFWYSGTSSPNDSFVLGRMDLPEGMPWYKAKWSRGPLPAE